MLVVCKIFCGTKQRNALPKESISSDSLRNASDLLSHMAEAAAGIITFDGLILAKYNPTPLCLRPTRRNSLTRKYVHNYKRSEHKMSFQLPRASSHIFCSSFHVSVEKASGQILRQIFRKSPTLKLAPFHCNACCKAELKV